MKLSNIACAFAMAAQLCGPSLARAETAPTSGPDATASAQSQIDFLAADGLAAAQAGQCAVATKKQKAIDRLLDQGNIDISLNRTHTKAETIIQADYLTLADANAHCLPSQTLRNIRTVDGATANKWVPALREEHTSPFAACEAEVAQAHLADDKRLNALYLCVAKPKFVADHSTAQRDTQADAQQDDSAPAQPADLSGPQWAAETLKGRIHGMSASGIAQAGGHQCHSAQLQAQSIDRLITQAGIAGRNDTPAETAIQNDNAALATALASCVSTEDLTKQCKADAVQRDIPAIVQQQFVGQCVRDKMKPAPRSPAP